MCGRLVVSEPDLSVLVEPFAVQQDDASGWLPRFNLAPTQQAPLITNERVRRVVLAQFGLVPGWAKDTKIASKLINARAETVATSKAFRRALTLRRGIIPVSGYFEWQRDTGRRKRPLFIHDDRGQPLALAGLWERWHGPEDAVLISFSVITRPAIGAMEVIHSRMPLALPMSAVDTWLSPGERTAEELAEVLQREPDVGHLVTRQISELVNSPRNDEPECIAEAVWPPPSRQLDLF
jgi:putative SOS response-associated peptidase YedK